MKKTSLFSLLLMTAGSLAHAQQTTPATPRELPPSGPMLQTSAGDFAHWVITNTPVKTQKPVIDKGAEAGGTSPTPVTQTVDITKTKPVFHLRTSNDATLVENRWIINDIQVVVPPGSTPFVSHPYGTTDVSYAKSDFPELAWISESNFDHVLQDPTSKRKVLVFKDVLSVKDEDGKVVDKKPAVAMVDFDTRLPVSSQEAAMIRIYQFKTPPDAMQVIPAEVLATLAVENRNQWIVRRQSGHP